MVGRGGRSGRFCRRRCDGRADDGRMRSRTGGATGAGAVATRTGREKAPPTWGRRGLKYEPYSAGFSSSLSLDLSNGFAGSLVSPELGSKR